MLTAYAENGHISKARQVFDEMPHRNIASWNAMITAYIRNGLRVNEAFELFCRMPERNSISHAAMITGFAQAGMMGEAWGLFSEMSEADREPVVANTIIVGCFKIGELEEAKRVFDGMRRRDVVSWSSMVDGYCKSGRIDEAKELFERMPERNVVSWTTLINGLLKFGAWAEGFVLLSRMRKETSIEVNSITLTAILDTCASLNRGEGIQVHGLVVSMGFESDAFLGNSIINMYCRAGCVNSARRMFDMMIKKNVVSWNTLLAGYIQNSSLEKAYALFSRVPHKDVVSWTTMIAGLSNNGRLEEAISLFREMEQKDDIAWTAIISGFVSNGDYERAFTWFIDMACEAIKPNSVTLSSVVCAAAGLANLNQGEQIHALVVKTEKEPDLSILNSLVSMYAKCGNIWDAYRIFTSIIEPNIVSMNSMITAFSQHGHVEEALELFRHMQEKGHEPNQVTFLGVLTACAHAGLVEEGKYHFASMKSSYFIEPGPDHYACMVDILGRAGQLKDAVDLIHSMPCEPHLGVWGALLSASRTHKDLYLAKVAAQHILDLEPNNATAYVVLSNMYADAKLTCNEEEVITVERAKRAAKIPGCSWIVV
ncbi:hypothetical protein Sjap_003604 [Stephania japonica]|uniref:Pentatricopeptide repeat-containing protein n=1 Tax=Stephania japonica TaxID=461633 RepID=A0AAP0KQU0_9MAGN